MIVETKITWIVSAASAVPFTSMLAAIDPFWQTVITPVCVLILGVVTVILKNRNRAATEATHKLVNSEMATFRKGLEEKMSQSLEDFKESLMKAAAFDAGTVKASAIQPSLVPVDPALVEIARKA